MMNQSKTVSPTQARILSAAAQHPAQLAEAPPNLPTAARNAVLQSMLRAGILEEVPSPDGSATTMVRITAAGLAAIGEPSRAEPVGEAVVAAQEGREGQQASIAASEAQEPPVAPAVPHPRITLRDAATALLVAWDAGIERSALPVSIEALRTALSRAGASGPAYGPSAPRQPREGTKLQAVLTLLRRPDGATIAQVIEATGWAQHTVRGFLAGLKRKGHTVEVLERVRQVGPGAQGTKGSYSVYRIAVGEQS